MENKSIKKTNPFKPEQLISVIDTPTQNRMKIYRFLIFLILLTNSEIASAQNSSGVGFTHVISATKDEKGRIYRPGTRLYVKYGPNSSVIRGIFAGVSDTSIIIGRRRISSEEVYISIDEIRTIRRNRPTQRIIAGILGTALMAGGIALVEDGSESDANGMRNAVGIVVIGTGVYFLLTIPISILFEKAEQKSRDKGWKFRLTRY